ncbi:MAG: hypothetical protein WD602_09670 [Actinomycetota bacterium]
MTPPGAQRRPAGLALAVGATAVGLLAGYLIKRQCAVNPWSDGFQYTHLCYNEIQALFASRGIQSGLIPYVDTAFEYPVLTAMFMDLAGRLLRGLVHLGLVESNSSGGYLAVSSALLSPFALSVTLLLRRLVTRGRLLLWALGPLTILYTFHNWDVLAVAGAVLGLVTLERQRMAAGGAALAAGAAAKLYPLFLLPGALLARLAAKDRRGLIRLVGGFVGIYAAVNVPWIIASSGPVSEAAKQVSGVQLREPGTNGWLSVWLFHADRYPDFWTVWYWIAKYGSNLYPAGWWGVGATGYRNFVSIASLVIFAGLCLWVLWRGWRRRAEPGGYPVAAVGMGTVAAFLLTSKVYSPQYALWMVPFLVLLTVPWRLVAAYVFSEVAVLIAGFRWFTVFDEPAPAWQGVLETAVWIRAAILVALLAVSVHATRLEPATEAGSEQAI